MPSTQLKSEKNVGNSVPENRKNKGDRKQEVTTNMKNY